LSLGRSGDSAPARPRVARIAVALAHGRPPREMRVPRGRRTPLPSPAAAAYLLSGRPRARPNPCRQIPKPPGRIIPKSRSGSLLSIAAGCPGHNEEAATKRP
jgi:hypothetical protein